MKKRFLAYAFLLAAIVSVTSGCMVHDGHGRRGYHHNGYHNGYNNGNGNYHNHDRGY